MTRPGRLLEEGGRGTRRRTVPAMERRTGPPMVRLRGQPTAQRRSGRPRRPERLGQRTARPMAPRWAPRSERLSRTEYRRQGPQRGRQLGRRWRLLGSYGDLETRSRPFHLPVKTSGSILTALADIARRLGSHCSTTTRRQRDLYLHAVTRPSEHSAASRR